MACMACVCYIYFNLVSVCVCVPIHLHFALATFCSFFITCCAKQICPSYVYVCVGAMFNLLHNNLRDDISLSSRATEEMIITYGVLVKIHVCILPIVQMPRVSLSRIAIFSYDFYIFWFLNPGALA
jgi:hypothetical protein